MLTGPFVVQLVYYQKAVFVAELHELSTIGIVRRTYMVHAELLHQQQSLLDGSRIGCSAQGTQRVVVGVSFQQYFLAVQLQSVLGANLNGAYTETLAILVCHGAVFTHQRYLCAIQVRMLRVPQLWIRNLHLFQFHLLCAGGCSALGVLLAFIDTCPAGVIDLQSYAYLLLLPFVGVFHTYCDKAIVACSDIQRVTLQIEFSMGRDEVDMTE